MSRTLLGATLGALVEVGSGSVIGVFTGTLMLNGTWTGVFVPNDIGDLVICNVGPMKIDGESELLNIGTTGEMTLLGDFVGSFVLMFRVEGDLAGAVFGALRGGGIGTANGTVIGEAVG